MFPVLMLAAQLLAKQQQQQEERRREVAKLAEDRAARLGANTAGVEAANFNRQLAEQNYGSPAELYSIYSTLDTPSKPTSGATSTTPGSDGLLDPWAPGNGGSRNDLIDPWSGTDPYGMKRRV